MPSNAEAAEIFRSIADLLDVLGEKFKPEAYRRAARSIETLTEDLARVAARRELRTIPGVGEAIEEKLGEYLATGRVAYYERLKREVPPGIVELLRLPGLGPKTARRFWVELGVEGPAELEEAIAAGRLEGRVGFGPKKIAQVRAALGTARAAPAGSGGRPPIEEVYPIAERLVAALRAVPGVERAEAAGSFRRGRETVGDLDILATSEAPERVFDTFSALPDVREVRLRGTTKETVVLRHGLQVDLRVVEPAAFGAALQYFTGSKDHNVHLRSIARDRGLKVNEYGVFRGDERLAGRTEEEVYGALGLPYIPPELREDRGEIEAAAKGVVPRLVEAEDVREDLHVHLPPSATVAEAEALLDRARGRRLRFLGIVVAGTDLAGNAIQLSLAVERALRSGGGLRVGRVLEEVYGEAPDIHQGSPGAEYRIVRPRAGPLPPGREISGGGLPIGVVAHLGPGRDGSPERLAGWVAWARAQGAGVEVGPGPERLDSTAARLAREAGARLALPSGCGAGTDATTAAIALGFARRAGAGSADLATAPLGPSADRARSTARR